MTAAGIIHEIDSLPPAELAVVVRTTKKPEEIGVLVDKFVEATDPVEVARLREEITEGFYAWRAARCRFPGRRPPAGFPVKVLVARAVMRPG